SFSPEAMRAVDPLPEAFSNGGQNQGTARMIRGQVMVPSVIRGELMPDAPRDWNQRYATGDVPWDSGQPSAELMRVLGEWKIQPCRALEMGCGTGENAVYLARQGFDVTAFDLAPLAIERAERKIRAAGVNVRLLKADVFNLPDVGPPFPFVFD